MADITLSIGARILECMVEPVLIRPLRPIFCFQTIVGDFRRECEKLNSEEVRVKNAIKQAKDNGREVYEDVDKWVEDVEMVVGDAQKLQNELRDDKSCCFSTGWTYHYCFSKNVRDNAHSIKKLCETAPSLNDVARPIDLRQHIGLPFSEDFMPSKSMDLALTSVMEALVNDNVNKIGLYGMGGSGKTTLAKQVVKEAERHKIVERAFIVPFPQTREVMIRSIQGTIADFLNVKLEQESIEGRASRLHQRLKNGEMVLIIIDDVTKVLDLAKLGIPSFGGCKVLFTTHDLQVCNSIQPQGDKIIQLGVLSEDEAWSLFKNVVGVGDVLKMHEMTKKVIQSCKGLPKVIINAGRSLRGKEPSQWEETLQKLKNDHIEMNCDGLHKEIEKLRLRQERVKNQVEIAKNNAQVIEKDVEKWLADVESIMKDAEQWTSKSNQSISYISDWDMLISKKGMQLITIVKNLFEDGAFSQVAHSAPIRQHMGLSSSEDFMVSKSADSAFHEIMEALGNDGVNMIGLYGMGGIGKTTLAKHVCKEVERSNIFDHVVMVTISQNPIVRTIQGVVADFYNLKLEQESEEGRASKLNQRLEREKILIILDDVWEKFDLAKIGIFRGECKDCKILLTTRRLHVCTSMRCQATIELELLSEDEAWGFFRKKADLSDDSNLNFMAKQIVGECNGLPIALTAVGSALRNKSLDDWIEALDKLQSSRLVEIPDVDKNAYKCLQLSYDYLKDSAEQAQFLLLLCSLFPEDYIINLEDLTRYAFGMGLFKRVSSIEDARRKVGVTVQILKDSGLLLGTDKTECVKMHDVVRDVALWIGASEPHVRSVVAVRDGTDLNELTNNKSFQNYRAISFMPDSLSELSNYDRLECPKLETILIFGRNFAVELPDTFFDHMKAVKVLDVKLGEGERDFSRYGFAMPPSLQYLTDLQMLNLRSCRCYDAHVVGQLTNLKILSLVQSDMDCELEEILMKMKKLRLLDMINVHFQAYQLLPNIITDMIKLEELRVLFTKELEVLYEFEGQHGNHESQLQLQILRLKGLHELKHVWKGSNRFVSLCNLTYVKISECPKLKSIFSSAMCIAPSLQQLQVLFISKCDDLEEVASASGDPDEDFSRCFQNLRQLLVYDCGNLKTIFSMHMSMISHPRLHLPNLQQITLWGNDELEHVFGYQTAEAQQWPSLQVVEVWCCPKLSSHFVANIQTQLQTPSIAKNLKTIVLDEMQGVEEIVQLQRRDEHDQELLTFHLEELGLHNLQDLKCLWRNPIQSICFSYLTEVNITNCNSLKQLFTVAIALTLKQLEMLCLMECNKLEEIIGVDNQVLKEKGKENVSNVQNNMISITFPKLKELILYNLPSLIRFCPATYNLVFPSLTRRDLKLKSCPRAIKIFMSSQRVTLKEEEEDEEQEESSD